MLADKQRKLLDLFTVYQKSFVLGNTQFLIMPRVLKYVIPN